MLDHVRTYQAAQACERVPAIFGKGMLMLLCLIDPHSSSREVTVTNVPAWAPCSLLPSAHHHSEELFSYQHCLALTAFYLAYGLCLRPLPLGCKVSRAGQWFKYLLIPVSRSGQMSVLRPQLLNQAALIQSTSTAYWLHREQPTWVLHASVPTLLKIGW